MQIEYLSTSSLIPYEFNNRNHDDTQIQRIAKSITEYGFNQPIIIDENRVVLVGHGRLLAAKLLRLKEVPVIQLSNLNETKKRAYRILDNKLQNDSTWAFNNLELELDALEDAGFDLSEWGLDAIIPKLNEDQILQDDQPSLDELKPKFVECPSCKHTFDVNKC